MEAGRGRDGEKHISACECAALLFSSQAQRVTLVRLGL